jgi:very-short-patch-repair endonuclease
MPIKNIFTGQKVTKEKLERDPSVLRTSPHFQRTKMGRCRREMTPAEKLLWQKVRAKKLGVRFRRQQIIQGFIVDFYCHKAALVVEVDSLMNPSL